jgi:hypothetical protein
MRTKIGFIKFNVQVLTFSVVFLLSVLPITTKAQCPSTPPTPSSIPWVDNGCVTLAISPACSVKVCFCTRNVFGILEYTVRSVQKLSGTCAGYSWPALIAAASDKLGLQLIHNSIPLCDDIPSVLVYQEVVSACWMSYNANPDPMDTPWPACKICPDELGYCEKIWEVCHDENWNIIKNLRNSSFVSGTCNPAPQGELEDGVCYSLINCN